MHGKQRKLSLVGGVAAVFLAAVATAQDAATQAPGAAAVGLRRPTVITRPGSYVVEKDIVAGSAAAAIEIHANDVTLDLAGHRLVGPGRRQGSGIAVLGASNVRIFNGHVKRFGIGVRAEEATSLVVEGLQIDGLDSGGAPPDVEVGILLVDTRGARIERNVITDVFLGIFVRGAGSGGNFIRENLVTGADHGELGVCYNPAPGQSSGGPHGDLVYLNVVSRFRRGVAMSADSTGNVVRENTVAYFDLAIEETTPGSNVISDNDEVQIPK